MTLSEDVRMNLIFGMSLIINYLYIRLMTIYDERMISNDDKQRPPSND